MIIIFEQDLTHYRVLFYEYLAENLEYEILVVYGKGEPGASHILEGGSSKRSFKTLEVDRFWVGSSIYFQSFEKVKAVVKNNNIACVIHRGAIRNLGLYKEISYFQAQGIPVILRGIGFSNKREFNPRKNIIDNYHRKVINKADAYLCYTTGSKKILDEFYNPSKIFVAVNTLNSQLLGEHYKRLTEIGKFEVKKELGLTKDKYLIHVGRLSARKKIKDLIDIYSLLKIKNHDLGLILVGDGAEKDGLIDYVNQIGLADIIFTGSISSEDLLVSKYIYVSDVFVITGNIGLSINHSFFFGVPVVGFIAKSNDEKPSNYIQTPEHEYLIDNYNGRVVQNYNNCSFANAVEEVFFNKELGRNAYDFSQQFLTVEKMAEGYKEAINYAISSFSSHKGS